MGTRGRAIVGLDVDKLLTVLNEAYADEWLAYYQYWIGAKVIKGPMKKAVEAELIVHATEELMHANLVADRIIQLGGTPLIDPQQWFKFSGCGYAAPADPAVATEYQGRAVRHRCLRQPDEDDRRKRPGDL